MIKGVVGIECGSWNSVISKIGRNGLESIQSESSNREIPCVIVFGDDQRMFAEIAQDRLKAYCDSAVVYPFRLCGDNEMDRGYQFFKYIKESNKAIIRQAQLELIQIVASFYTYLDSLIYNNLGEQQRYACVVSVPNYFTLTEKMRLQQACSIAKLPCIGIVEEHAAVGYCYLWCQKKELQERKRKVLFIDVGQSQTSCYIYDFDKLCAKTEYVDSNRSLGVRNIDQMIYDFLKSKYPEIFKGLSKKSEIRVGEQIEKMRKILSTNTQANLMIECLTSELDLHHNFTREEFEGILNKGGFVMQWEEMLNKAASYALQQEFNIDEIEIEILGGGSRIPLIQQIIKTFFGREKLGVSYQGCETVSRGCAIACAIAATQINPLIKIEHYRLTNILKDDLSVELYVNNKKCSEQNYLASHFLPSFATLTAEISESLFEADVELRFNNVRYRTKERISGNLISIAYQIAENGMLHVKQASIFQDNSGRMIDESLEGKDMNTETHFHLQPYFDGKYQHEIGELLKQEEEFRVRDGKASMRIEKRNFLERYINDSLSFAKEQLKLYIQPSQLDPVVQQLNEYKEYIENNLSANLEDIQQRIQAIKDIYEPLKSIYSSRQQQTLPIHSIEELKNISMQYAQREIQDIQLKLSNQSIGDGGGIIGFFKSNGAVKIKEYLSLFSISRSLSIELGNNSFTDAAIKHIFKGLSMKSTNLSELSINLESNLRGSNTNVLTSKSLTKIIKFIRKLNNLEILDLCLNFIQQNDLQVLQQVLLQKNKLKQVRIQIKNFEQNSINRDSFITNVKKVCSSVIIDCFSPTGMKVF